MADFLTTLARLTGSFATDRDSACDCSLGSTAGSNNLRLTALPFEPSDGCSSDCVRKRLPSILAPDSSLGSSACYFTTFDRPLLATLALPLRSELLALSIRLGLGCCFVRGVAYLRFGADSYLDTGLSGAFDSED